MIRILLCALLVMGSAIPSGVARAEPSEKAIEAKKAGSGGEDADKKGGPLTQSSLFVSGSAAEAPWRGSQFVVRTSVSALTLDPGAEQTYNPYAAMTFSFRPWWWFTEHYFMRGTLGIIRELTDADFNTYEGEATLTDLRLIVGAAGLWTIPWVGIHVSVDLAFTLPTSKLSQAQTLALSIAPGLRLSRAFRWRGGINMGYNLRLTPRLYRYTTAERESPLISSCTTDCTEALFNLGRRNPYLRFSQSVDISAKFFDWLGAYVAAGHAVDWLYDAKEDPGAAPSPVEDASATYLTFFELAVTFRPLDLLEIGLGYTVVHPLRAPDSSYYVPFFNRFSAFFVDVKIHVQGVVSRLKRIL
ncbi:MAG: hypothetical protein CSA65_03625 [Proteobacteria bacterium]|nr:MAG: hypothetical protein CSA65_03625 [Pseudomonadota bacterium]